MKILICYAYLGRRIDQKLKFINNLATWKGDCEMKNLKELRSEIEMYLPYNEQEEKDQTLMLHYLDTFGEKSLVRECVQGHFTASAFVFNKAHTKVLMCEHIIDKSLAWLGGHADGMVDLLKRVKMEINEESGITRYAPMSKEIAALTAIAIPGHIKNQKYVSSHIHLDVAYIFEADEEETLVHQEEENEGVRWVTFEELRAQVSDTWKTKYTYEKLIEQYGR